MRVLACLAGLVALAAGHAAANPPRIEQARSLSPEDLGRRLLGDAGSGYSRVDLWAYSPSGRTLSQANFWTAPSSGTEPGLCEAHYVMVAYTFDRQSVSVDRVDGRPQTKSGTVYAPAPQSPQTCGDLRPTFLSFFRAPSARLAAMGLAALSSARVRSPDQIGCAGLGCDDVPALLARLGPGRLLSVDHQRCGDPFSVIHCFVLSFLPEALGEQTMTIGPGDAVSIQTFIGYNITPAPPPPPAPR